MRRETYRSIRDVPPQEYLAGGTGLCGGCGGLLALRLFHKALGPNVVFCNAAGCLTMLAVFPFSPFRSSWLYTAMASAPAGAQGLRDALDVLVAKGRRPPEEDLQVVVVTGDGSANGIGLQSTLGAVHRGLDFWYLCYDNEGFANTGFQSSPASPRGSRTGTTPVSSLAPGGNPMRKQDLFALWRAAGPAYLATVSPSHPLDLLEKVARARALHGPKLFLSLAACAPGWGLDPAASVEVARLAVESGVWPLKELLRGELLHTVVPHRLRPVEEYLRTQQRYQHLFEPARQEALLAELQADVDGYWAQREDAAARPAAQRAAAQRSE